MGKKKHQGDPVVGQPREPKMLAIISITVAPVSGAFERMPAGLYPMTMFARVVIRDGETHAEVGERVATEAGITLHQLLHADEVRQKLAKERS